MDAAANLKLEQMSKDLSSLETSFQEHSSEDATYKATMLTRDSHMQDTLASILNKLDPTHEEYINKFLEKEMQTIKTNMEPLLEIYNGWVFGKKALVGTAGIVVAITVISGSIYAALKLLKP